MNSRLVWFLNSMVDHFQNLYVINCSQNFTNDAVMPPLNSKFVLRLGLLSQRS